MIRILANDGIDAIGKKMLTEAGYEVSTDKVPQEKLGEGLKSFDAVIVRSASTITKEIIAANPQLKLIGRAGIGLDNIDVAFAKEKGIAVVNTPNASSQSVAELVFAHLFSLARLLHDSNRKMPVEGVQKFDVLKKKYSAGVELKDKTIGIIGVGKIGQAAARIALGLGMRVLPYKRNAAEIQIDFDFFKTHADARVVIKMKTVPFEQLLAESDFITLHVPFPKGSAAVLSKNEFNKMKNGVCIINTSRGGVVAEQDLLDALNSGKVAGAGLDVFKGEPSPMPELLAHPNISLSPHIGASTKEAQERIGVELARQVAEFFK